MKRSDTYTLDLQSYVNLTKREAIQRNTFRLQGHLLYSLNSDIRESRAVRQDCRNNDGGEKGPG